jgi:hypothetical protein
MSRCIHELDTSTCADCRPRPNSTQMVYATPGGSVVHRRPDCEMLARGQAAVESNDGRVGIINPVFRDKYPGRGDCSWCMADLEIGQCTLLINGKRTSGSVINVRPLGYGHKAYLVRYESTDGKVLESQFKRNQLTGVTLNGE